MIESSHSRKPTLFPGTYQMASAGMKPRISFNDWLTGGPSHIIIYNDGSKDLFALSMMKKLVAEHQAVLNYGDLKDDIESKLQLVREKIIAS